MRGFRNGFDVLRDSEVESKIVESVLKGERKYQEHSGYFVEKMKPCTESDGVSPVFKVTKKTTDCIKGL